MTAVSTADATTERIRAAAVRLFAERGYGNTTIEHISTAAGVGVATIYRRWSDKAAIANELYGEGIDWLRSMLDQPHDEDPRSDFIAMWRQMWEWASSHRDQFLFINASAGAPWLSEENVACKADVAAGELGFYARLGIDAAPDFAAALIGGTMVSVLDARPDIEPGEVAERLWQALVFESS